MTYLTIGGIYMTEVLFIVDFFGAISSTLWGKKDHNMGANFMIND